MLVDYTSIYTNVWKELFLAKKDCKHDKHIPLVIPNLYNVYEYDFNTQYKILTEQD